MKTRIQIGLNLVGAASAMSLLYFSQLCCTAQDKGESKGKVPQKVEGWRSAKWGMTEDQILDAFKDEAKKLPKEEDWKTGVASIGIEKLEIVEEPFEARFIFETQSRRLRKVNLSAQKA